MRKTRRNMEKIILKEDHQINPEMTVLDIISRYKRTEAVFKQYDKQAGKY